MDHRRVALLPMKARGQSIEEFYASRDLKKAMCVRLGYDSYPLHMETVYCFFDIPMCEAARIMRILVSLLKRIRTWVGVEQWPCFIIHGDNPALFGLSRDQIIKGRNDMISKMEESPFVYGLALSIVKEARDYAVVYSCLVIPGVGRRHSKKMELKKGGESNLLSKSTHTNTGTVKTKEVFKTVEKQAIMSRKKVTLHINVHMGDTVEKFNTVTMDAKRVQAIMESMQPRMKLTHTTETEVIEDIHWPIQEVYYDVEDVLELGPLNPNSLVLGN